MPGRRLGDSGESEINLFSSSGGNEESECLSSLRDTLPWKAIDNVSAFGLRLIDALGLPKSDLVAGP